MMMMSKPLVKLCATDHHSSLVKGGHNTRFLNSQGRDGSKLPDSVE